MLKFKSIYLCSGFLIEVLTEYISDSVVNLSLCFIEVLIGDSVVNLSLCFIEVLIGDTVVNLRGVE